MIKKTDIADLLLNAGLISRDAIQKAREETQRTGLTLEKALEKLGFATEEDIARARASALGLPYMDLTDYLIDQNLLKLVPEAVARKYKVVPLFKVGNTLTVAMVDPNDILALDQVRRVSHMDGLETVLASEKGMQKFLDAYYAAAFSVKEIIESLEKEKLAAGQAKGAGETAEDAAMIKLVNAIVSEARRERASDIHIEPEEDILRIRYRIDGLLHETTRLAKKFQNSFISRIKVISNMDIAESRKPQDGRIRMKLDNRELDVRVSTFPTVHGENVVLRLLDKASVLMGLKELGFASEDLEVFEKLVHRPNGIILVTGPTGSGKTTTLYAALTSVNTIDKNLITIEDPVEYELPLIRQTQVNPKADITFAVCLRSVLRQDPDIIMVGEIRDKETVEIAIQAALTGHLVFSTLHTNDAAAGVARLIDMGVEPFLISSSVIGILAQRLVRVICEKCKEEYAPDPEVLQELGMEPGTRLWRGKGCGNCKGTGFAGRIGIFEMLVVNDEIRRMIEGRRSAEEIKKCAVAHGMKTLRQDGLAKIRKGQTTPESVFQATEIER